jgi:hypothetical protein
MKDTKKRNRVSVLKHDRKGPGPHKRDDWTTLYFKDATYDELLDLANGDAEAIAKAVRMAAERLNKRPDRTWTETCISGGRTLLTKARAVAEAEAAKLAAENNKAWDSMQ